MKGLSTATGLSLKMPGAFLAMRLVGKTYLLYRYAPLIEYSCYVAYYSGKAITWFIPDNKVDESDVTKDWVMCDYVDTFGSCSDSDVEVI